MIDRRTVLTALAAGLSLPALAYPPRPPRGGGGRPGGPLSVGVPAGSPAPDFVLSDVHTGEPVQLSALYAQTPVVLIFGSFT